MTLRFYDTASAEVRDFVPLVPGKVSLYYCGATVQGMPHVGHIRSAIAFDQLTRWLQYRGFRVTVVRNVTDIDDKILAKSEASFHPDFEQEPGAVPEEDWRSCFSTGVDEVRRGRTSALSSGQRMTTTCAPRSSAQFSQDRSEV